MKTPFTIDQFFGVFKTYNESVAPMQGILYLLAAIAVILTFKNSLTANKIISSILAFLWLWMGIVYHLIFFKEINSAANIFGVLFILQGIFFLVYGVLKNRISFSLPADKFGVTGAVMIGYALVIYPLWGYFSGHSYPASPTFGLPCPTTIFTFGMLMFTGRNCPVLLLIIPFAWSLLGFTAALNFGIAEDIGLPVTGAVALSMLLWQKGMV